MNPDLVLLQSATMFAMAGAVLALSTYVTLWTGQLSFGTVTFAAIGGFGATWLVAEEGVNLWLAVAIGAVAAGAAGLLVGRVFAKLSSHWLALATVALVLITRVFVTNLGDYTGGSEGRVVPFTLSMGQMAIMLVIVCIVLFALRRSKFGIAADAAREDPNVASALGVPVTWIKIVAFGLSGAIGAVGGVMQASQLAYIGPDTFYVDLSVTIIASVVLGGAFHWFGSVIGAIVFTGLPVYISQYITVGQSIINGALLLAIILFLPGGLIDPVRWRRLREKRRSRRTRSSAPADAAATSSLVKTGAGR